MGNGKLRLSALGCLGGKATEFSRRIAWARSRCHALNIRGSWFFYWLILCLCHAFVPVSLWGQRWGSARAAWCHCVLLCFTIIYGQFPHPKSREVQREASTDLVVSEQGLRAQWVPCVREWVLLCLALTWKIIAFLSYEALKTEISKYFNVHLI